MSENNVCQRVKKQTTSELITTSLSEFVVINIIIYFIASFTSKYFHFDPLYIYSVIGLSVSLLTTYYKYKIWRDPSYKSSCNCITTTQDRVMNGVLNVLDHKKSKLLFNIPNSVYGIMFYSFMIGLIYMDPVKYFLIIKLMYLTGCIGGLYLWYTMVFEIGHICILCMTIHSANFCGLFF